jgi:YfiH family protein
MPFQQPDSIRYYTFESLSDQKGLKHAVFTRRGGVSPAPWAALNLGGTVGDDPRRVAENREMVFRTLDRPKDSLFDVWQVHSSEVVCTRSPRPLDLPHKKADAILTDQPGITLFMRFADCVPILLFDPQKRVIGLVHAGWKGTVIRTAAEAVRRMRLEYGSVPEDILAAIGPSIAAHHYEVGKEVMEQVRGTFGEDASGLLSSVDGDQVSGVQFDLWAANRLILEQEGVKQIEISGICTACHLEDWYSHRGEKGKTGRFGVLMGFEG